MTLLTDPTVMQLTSNIRSMLNQPNELNSMWSNAELRTWMNDGIREYFCELVTQNEGQFNAVVLLDIVSGQEEIPLPTDFFEARTVWKKSDNIFITLPYDNSVTNHVVTQVSNGSSTFFPSYRFRGNTLVLNETPMFSEVGGIRLEYSAFPEELALGTDTTQRDFSPIFKNLLETYVIYQAKLKESLVNGADLTVLIKRKKDELEQKFKEIIAARSKAPQFTIPFSPENE